jgi:hypothetical protein
MMPRQPVIRSTARFYGGEMGNAVPIPTENIWEMRGQPIFNANALSVPAEKGIFHTRRLKP